MIRHQLRLYRWSKGKLDVVCAHPQSCQTTEQPIQERRSQLDVLMIRQGELQRQQQQLGILRQDQALMIENLLPQFEAGANRILAQISGHQLHLQFVTQRVTKSKRARRMVRHPGYP